MLFIVFVRTCSTFEFAANAKRVRNNVKQNVTMLQPDPQNIQQCVQRIMTLFKSVFSFFEKEQIYNKKHTKSYNFICFMLIFVIKGAAIRWGEAVRNI